MLDMIPFGKRNNAIYNPFQELDALEKAFFGRNDLGEFKTDIKDVGNAFELEADLPGFKKEDIKVDLKDQYLTISAKRDQVTEEKDQKGNYIRRERSYGTFSRSFEVSGIQTQDITASYQDGVLKLKLPKKEVAVPDTRSISIE